MTPLPRVVYPRSGTLRVSPAPALLPSRRRLGEPGLNRFDDPDGWFSVRYIASTLRGCLIELLARFRHHATAEKRIGGVIGTDADGARAFVPSLAADIGDWLVLQRVGVCHLDDADAEVLSVNDANCWLTSTAILVSAPLSGRLDSAAPSAPLSWTAPPCVCLAALAG